MIVKSLISPVNKISFEEYKNRTLKDIIALFKKLNVNRLYLVENGDELLYVFDIKEIITICENKEEDILLDNYVAFQKPPLYVEVSDTLIDIYNFMRENFLNYVAVLENEKLIGEIEFDKLRLRIGLIIIQDPLTGVFNEEYFNFLLKEYNKIGNQLGIIYVEIENLSIIEAIYGEKKRLKILKTMADLIRKSVREIDFIFRSGSIFKVVIFSEFSTIGIVTKRFYDKFDGLIIDGITIKLKIAYAHVPTDSPNVLLAVEKIEEELAKKEWD